MSHLVNLSDELYEELTAIKKIRNVSYSEVIQSLLHEHAEEKKTTDWQTMIARARERDRQFKGKKEKIDHDLIAYGVSRDSA